MYAMFASSSFVIFCLTLRLVFANVDLHCPKECHCNDRVLEVTCGEHSLTEFPHGIPMNTVILDLHSNNIETFNSSDLKDLGSLETIRLSSNWISSIQASSFERNSRLENVFLDNNLLTVIPGDAFGETTTVARLDLAWNRIRSIKEMDLARLKTLRVLNLAGNSIAFLPHFFFKTLQGLEELDLRHNHIAGTLNLLTDTDRYHGLRMLDLSNNNIASLFVTPSAGFPQLYSLNLSSNAISNAASDRFLSFVGLQYLDLRRNPIQALEENTFASCPILEILILNELPPLKAISRNAFAGLRELKQLEICHNPNLRRIHPETFGELRQLQVLRLQNNSLSVLEAAAMLNLSSLRLLDLSGNKWLCDCSNRDFLVSLKPLVENQLLVTSGFVCSQPESRSGCLALDIDVDDLRCEVSHTIGSVATLDCPIFEEPLEEVTWTTNRLRQYSFASNHRGESSGHDATSDNPEPQERFRILSNGSLVINGVARWDGGQYRCVVGNWSRDVYLRLDYTVVSTVTIKCLIVGFLSAAAFFGIAVLFSAIRRCAFACSKEDRAKRKSIHEVMNSIRNGMQMDRFSAYRTAKLDQLSAFRSATMDQLSAFTTARIGRLRTYKQMTVTNVLQYLERMRQHYAMQTARIKDHCSLQVDRLRENYASQKKRLTGQRSQQIRKIRDNYNAQAMKVREYRAQQMLRLREQYKLQQQHLLKLLELLDIGNCVNVIEAECIRTESTIFDADITFDVEAQAIHVPQDQTSHPLVELGDISESSSLTGDRESSDARDEEGFEVPPLDDIVPEKFDADGGSAIDAIFGAHYALAEGATGHLYEGGFEEFAEEPPTQLTRNPGRKTTTNVVRAQIETSSPPRCPSLVVAGDGEVVVETVF